MAPSGISPEKDQKQRDLFVVQFHFTEKCNLRCVHCYESTAQTRDQALEVLYRIIDRTFPVIIDKWGRRIALALTGGEPFASPNLYPLFTYIHDRYRAADVDIRILTNGTLITEEDAKILASYPMMKGVQISLDGTRQETHEKIRGPGTFHKALRGCEIMVGQGIIVNTHLVVTNINYKEAFELPDMARNHGFNLLTITRLVPIGRGHELGDLEISPSQVRELYAKLNRDAEITGASRRRPFIARWRCDWPVLYTPPGYRPEELYYPFKGNGGSCAIGDHGLTMLQDGTVLACQRLPVPIGNVLEEDLETIWNHPFLWKVRLRHRYIKGKCQQCEFMRDKELRFACGGGGALCINYGRYGDAFCPDDGCTYEPEAARLGVCQKQV